MTINAGADENVEDNKSTQYGKVGIAVSNMQKEGIVIANPDINEAQFSFDPDVENNAIIYALKAINGIGDDACKLIIQHRPYSSFDDFCVRMLDTKLIKPSQMIMLIKAGCFLKLHNQDRAVTMREYLTKYKFNKIEKLTMSQLNIMKEYGIIPSEYDLCLRTINFKNYVLHPDGFYKNVVQENKKVPKCGYHDRLFVLDNDSQSFFAEHLSEESVVEVNGNGHYIISEKKFIKEIDKIIQPLKDWFVSEEAVKQYNNAQFEQIWLQFAFGNEAKWSMQALTYYDDKHELDCVNEEKYGIVNFFELPEEPQSYETYTRYINGEPKEMPKYVIYRLAGTVLNADNNHHTVSILTCYGCVNLKFYKEAYAHYNHRISQPNGKGGKTVLEDSWFKRGTLLIACGFRSGDTFILRNYSDTVYKHTLNRITQVNEDGTLEIQVERIKI